MVSIAEYPLLVFAVSFPVLWISGWVGRSLLRGHILEAEVREDFGTILGASLTLLGLLIGFSFSMATSRYDQRKDYEEAEANAIGTEYLRADLLPAADAAKIRPLLKSYLEQRMLYYTARSEKELEPINAHTAQLQAQLWAAVKGPVAERPTPLTALAVSGMNDVLNSQGYTQAGYWNRIPLAAWILMIVIAVGCNMLVGFGSRSKRAGAKLLPILPLIVSVAFTLIADIESPRHGVIRVTPQNLISLAESLQSPGETP